MYQFLETIKIDNLEPCNLDFHQKRVNQTFQQFYPTSIPFKLKNLIDVESLKAEQIYKCRVEYNQQDYAIEYENYSIRPLDKICIVPVDDLEYQYKYLDRTALNNLKNTYPDYDDLIFVKNGYITDCSYANLIFSDGDKWYTPDTYLLNGTKRQMLLEKKQIFERKIGLNDLHNYKSGQIINSMIEIGDLNFDIAKLLSIR